MKVYAEVLPTWLGRAIYRFNDAVKKYAPAWVEFVKDPQQAELQILDVIGQGSLDFLYKDKYILNQECFLTADSSDPNIWYDYWNRSKLVVSFYDLPGITNRTDFNFIRLPWGVDPNVFYDMNIHKSATVLTTGYVSDTECITECFKAVRKSGSFMYHVGADLFKDILHCQHFENISDDDMRALYNKSLYTLGTRKIEGFEVPLLEGLLCRSRGITLDYENYKYWYGDLVEYIKDGDSKFITDQLQNLFSLVEYRKVTDDEINFVKDKFNWAKVMKDYWIAVEESL